MIISHTKLVDAEKKPTGTEMLWFWCPACDDAHAVYIGAGTGPRWTWDGNLEKPTIDPSVRCLKADNSTKCHFFIRNGQFVYCSDNAHALNGQTVDMPELPEWLAR